MIALIHITDFHIAGSDTEGDPLRVANYDDFIDSLVAVIKEDAEGIDNVYIVATGDFVHQGAISAFPHASVVLKYLAESLGVPLDNVFVCIGNHDFSLADDKSGNYDAAREDFRAFSSEFGGDRFASSECFEFFKRNGISFLMLDSTRGGEAEKPGILSEGQEDQIKTLVKSAVNRDEILVIGSHHPVNLGLAKLSHVDDANASDHYWKGGIQTSVRVSRARKNCAPCIWLSGDIHFADRRFDEDIFHVVTARFGTPRDPNSSITRQARALYVRSDTQPVMSTFSFDPGTHHDHGSLGEWEVKSSKQSFLGAPSQYPTISSEGNGVIGPLFENSAIASKVIRIDEELESKIVSAIGELGIYQLGKFATNSKIISAAWVSIGPLMNLPDIFSIVVDKMGNWINAEASMYGCLPADVLCIGVDCWGAVLSSQLSVFMGFNNTCVAARGNAEHSSHWERVSERVIERATAAKVVVFVSDVISTGKTVRFIWEKLCESPKFVEPDSKRFLAACLISDGKVVKEDDFLSSIGACCCALRMPVFDVDDFPSNSVVPTQISFH